MGLMSTKAQANLQQSFEAIYAGVSQKVVTVVGSTQGSAFTAKTSVIRVFATKDCHLAFGADPTAVADGTNMFLPAGMIDYIGVTPGQKVAAIRDAADGVLYITEGL